MKQPRNLQEALRTVSRVCILHSDEKPRLVSELGQLVEQSVAADFARLVAVNRITSPLAELLASSPTSLAPIQALLSKGIEEGQRLAVMRDKMLRKLTRVISSAGIDYTVFKTINLSGAVGVDIDLMIGASDFEPCVETLVANGFYAIDSLSKTYATGFMLRNNPIILDLHTKLAVLNVEYISSRALLDHTRELVVEGADGFGPIKVDYLERPWEAVVRAAHAVIKESRITIGDIYEVWTSSSGAEAAVQKFVQESKLQIAWSLFNKTVAYALGIRHPDAVTTQERSKADRIATSMLQNSFDKFSLPFEIPVGASALALFDTSEASGDLVRSLSRFVASIRYRRNATTLGQKITHKLPV